MASVSSNNALRQLSHQICFYLDDESQRHCYQVSKIWNARQKALKRDPCTWGPNQTVSRLDPSKIIDKDSWAITFIPCVTRERRTEKRTTSVYGNSSYDLSGATKTITTEYNTTTDDIHLRLIIEKIDNLGLSSVKEWDAHVCIIYCSSSDSKYSNSGSCKTYSGGISYQDVNTLLSCSQQGISKTWSVPSKKIEAIEWSTVGNELSYSSSSLSDLLNGVGRFLRWGYRGSCNLLGYPQQDLPYVEDPNAWFIDLCKSYRPVNAKANSDIDEPLLFWMRLKLAERGIIIPEKITLGMRPKPVCSERRYIAVRKMENPMPIFTVLDEDHFEVSVLFQSTVDERPLRAVIVIEGIQPEKDCALGKHNASIRVGYFRENKTMVLRDNVSNSRMKHIWDTGDQNRLFREFFPRVVANRIWALLHSRNVTTKIPLLFHDMSTRLVLTRISELRDIPSIGKDILKTTLKVPGLPGDFRVGDYIKDDFIGGQPIWQSQLDEKIIITLDQRAVTLITTSGPHSMIVIEGLEDQGYYNETLHKGYTPIIIECEFGPLETKKYPPCQLNHEDLGKVTITQLRGVYTRKEMPVQKIMSVTKLMSLTWIVSVDKVEKMLATCRLEQNKNFKLYYNQLGHSDLVRPIRINVDAPPSEQEPCQDIGEKPIGSSEERFVRSDSCTTWAIEKIKKYFGIKFENEEERNYLGRVATIPSIYTKKRAPRVRFKDKTMDVFIDGINKCGQVADSVKRFLKK